MIYINTETDKPKEYFEAAIFFAYTISKIKGIKMSEAAENFTGLAREITGMFKEDWEQVKSTNLWSDLKAEFDKTTDPKIMTNMFFNTYKKQVHSKYDPDESKGYVKFGSIAYDYQEDSRTVRLHFLPERSTVSALSSKYLKERENDFKNLLEDVSRKYPEASFVKSSTWLQNIPNYRNLFSQKFQDGLKDIGASSFIGIWGQFQKGDGFGNVERLKEFKNKLLQAKTLEEAIDAFPFKVLENIGPIAEFYEKYNI
jgi:hypothetical protein